MPKNTRQNKDLGYGYNDIIGKQGIEKWGEQYLRGIDGTTGTTKEVNGKEITVMNDAEPVPGDYIVLTLIWICRKWRKNRLQIQYKIFVRQAV